MLAIPALKFQAPELWDNTEPSLHAAFALCAVKQERQLWIQERLHETAIHKDADRQAQASVLYGLEIPKAPILVMFSAGDSPTAGQKSRKGVCS